MNFQMDLFGVPWLGTALAVLGAFVACFLAVVIGKTVRQLGAAPVPKADLQEDPATDPGKPRGPVKKAAKAQASEVVCNNHRDIHSPLGANGSRTMFNRISPLFYEEAKDGKWKISMGRVSFWVVLGFFLAMCAAVQVSLSTGKSIDPNLPTLYLGVISMLFLLTLGLLGYNLGSKFTDPMSKFIVLWAQRGQQPAAPAPVVEAPPAPAPAAPEEGMPSPNEDPEA